MAAVGRGCRWGVYGYYYAYAERAVAGELVQGDFYTTVAQVLPVLLLALTVDVSQSKALGGADIAWIVLVALAGEGTALTAAAFADQRGPFNFSVLIGSLVGLGLALVMALAAGQEQLPATPSKKARRK
jgi:hypothetical protein